MAKLIDYLKSNIKMIVVVTIIILLIGIVFIINSNDNKETSYTSTDIQKSETEIKLARLLTNIEGVGDSDVMINESEGTITGVVIVCRGADNIMTRNDILNAVSTALNINKSIIAIYSMTV